MLSRIDMTIHDRQGARREIYKIIEAPVQPSSTEEIREAIEEDELKEDEPNDDLRDNHV